MFYPEELVEEVRERSDIVDFISSYVKLTKKGSNYMGLCPFHNEKTPSFSVSRAKQMYYCFGCGAGGNVFTFLMEYESLTFPEAVRYLSGRAGIALPEEEYSGEAKKQADLKTRLLELQKQAATYFYCRLKSERGVRAYGYLRERGLSDETITGFGLGYADKYSDDLYRYFRQKGYPDDLLGQSGLVTLNEARGGQDKFWNRVMFPIMDINNRVIGFGGRVMGEGTPKYLNSPETKIFDKSRNLYGLNRARLSRKRQILLCEGYMDVIALHQAGFTNAVASLGTAFTGRQAGVLKRYADEILLTYDSDEAGTKAALRAIPILKEAGLSAKVIRLTPYKDPDEFIKGCGTDAFAERIGQAENSFYFEIEVLERGFDLTDPEQKTRFFNETAKKLLVFEEEIERNNYIEAVARKYGVAFEDLRRLVHKYGAQIIPEPDYGTRSREDYSQKKAARESGIRKSQKLLLTWLIEEPVLFEKLRGILSPSDFKEEPYRKAAGLLFEQYEQEKRLNPAKVITKFENKEEQSEVAGLFNSELALRLKSADKEKALNETVKKIKKYSLDYDSSRAADVSDLQRIIKEQAGLAKLHITL